MSKGMLNTTAGAIRAVLCFIDPTNTPKIAYYDDKMAQPLIDKLKESIGDRDGTQPVWINWSEEENELQREFHAVCEQIKGIFDTMEFCSRPQKQTESYPGRMGHDPTYG